MKYTFQEATNPWKVSYDKKRKAIWERDPKYCDKVKQLQNLKNNLRNKKTLNNLCTLSNDRLKNRITSEMDD